MLLVFAMDLCFCVLIDCHNMIISMFVVEAVSVIKSRLGYTPLSPFVVQFWLGSCGCFDLRLVSLVHVYY